LPGADKCGDALTIRAILTVPVAFQRLWYVDQDDLVLWPMHLGEIP